MSEQQEEDVDFHSVEDAGGSGRPKAKMYERSAPLPMRVRDGSFQDDHFLASGEKVLYSAVKCLALGVIDQMVKDSELKKGALQKMVKKVTGGDDSDSAKERAKQTRQIYILDVFTDLQEQPYRFEGGSVNYKSFLDKVTYVSHHNFYRFCVHFARRVPHAKTTSSLLAFVAKRREKVSHYDDFHDFELEIAQQIRFDRDLLPVSELDLSRDSWMEEWTDDDV